MDMPRFHFLSHRTTVVILMACSGSVWSEDIVHEEAAIRLSHGSVSENFRKVRQNVQLRDANIVFHENVPQVHVVHHIDHLVYGTSVIFSQQQIQNQLGNKVQQLSTEYDLTEAQRSKLLLAAQCEAKEFSTEVDALRHRYDTMRDDIIGKQVVEAEAQALQKKRRMLFGPDSFSSKVMARTVTGEQLSKYQAVLDERLRLRHRSNIEGAIRDIERQVVIKIEQHEALVELLLSEIPPPKSAHDYDETVVKYQFSRISDQKLRPVFEDGQWPQVRQLRDGFHEFGHALIQQGVIDEDGTEPSKPATTPQQNRLPTDATPFNGNRVPQEGKKP
jgi:hypothetical protein